MIKEKNSEPQIVYGYFVLSFKGKPHYKHRIRRIRNMPMCNVLYVIRGT